MGITKARKSPHKTAYNKRVKKSIITKTPMFYLLLIYKIKNARERASPKRWCFFLRKNIRGDKEGVLCYGEKTNGKSERETVNKNK